MIYLHLRTRRRKGAQLLKGVLTKDLSVIP